MKVAPWWSWKSFLVGIAGALVVLGGTWAGIAIYQADQAAKQQAWEACMARAGYSADDPIDDLDDLDGMVAAAEVCDSLRR